MVSNYSCVDYNEHWLTHPREKTQVGFAWKQDIRSRFYSYCSSSIPAVSKAATALNAKGDN